jgi:hypothetical protein
MSVAKKKNILFFILIAIFIEGCTSIKTGNLTDSLLLNGDNNFVIYSPNKSNTYRTTEVHTKIDYHYETINLIDKTINNYEMYEQRLDDLFREKKISKKDYFDNKEKVKNLKNEAKTKRTEAQKALNEWKNLLQSSSLNDERRNKFIADSIAFEDQKRVAAEQNRREKERLETENRRIENERRRLAEKEAEINNRTVQPIESPSGADEIPDNCYTLSIQSDLFGFRTRKLTQAELNACNQCQSYVYSDGSRGYEDMSKSSCILKKKIDDETDLGSLRNGAFVQLLNKDGSFYRVRDVSTGKIGYIAGKYAGVSTLVKTSCK